RVSHLKRNDLQPRDPFSTLLAEQGCFRIRAVVCCWQILVINYYDSPHSKALALYLQHLSGDGSRGDLGSAFRLASLRGDLENEVTYRAGGSLSGIPLDGLFHWKIVGIRLSRHYGVT